MKDLNMEAELVGVKKDVEYLKECCDKLDGIRNGDNKQNQSLINIESRLKYQEEFMEAHREWHNKLAEKKDNRNWQLWIILIGLVVTTIGSVLAIKLV